LNNTKNEPLASKLRYKIRKNGVRRREEGGGREVIPLFFVDSFSL